MAGIPDFIRIGPVVLVHVGGTVGCALAVVAGIIREFVRVSRLSCVSRIIDRALVEGIPDFIRIGPVVLVLVGGAVGLALPAVAGSLLVLVRVSRLSCVSMFIDRALVAGIPAFIPFATVFRSHVGGAVGCALAVVAGIIREFVRVSRLSCVSRIIDRALVEGIPDFVRIGSVVLVGGAVGWALAVVAGVIQEFVRVSRLSCGSRTIDQALVQDIREFMRASRLSCDSRITA